MTEPRDPDADYSARLATEHDRERRNLLSVMPLVAGLAGGLVAGLILALGDLQGAARSAAAMGLVAAVLLFVWGLIQFNRTQPNEDSIKLYQEVSWAERLLRDRTRGLVFGFLPLVGLMPLGIGAAWDMVSGEGNFARGLTAAVLVMMPMMLTLALSGLVGGISPRMRKYLEDEHTQAIRQQAMSLGFIVLMLGTSVQYVLGLWRADLAVVLTLPVMAIAAFVAVVRFALLERAAERGDDAGG